MDVSKCKATIAFLPYAAQREENGMGKPLISSFHTARSSPAFLPSHTGYQTGRSIFGNSTSYFAEVCDFGRVPTSVLVVESGRRYRRHDATLDIGSLCTPVHKQRWSECGRGAFTNGVRR